jgi:hypothetical protein
MSIVSIIIAIFDTTKKQNIPGARKTTHLIFKSNMGINHLTLSPEMISILYPESLMIEIGPEKSPSKPKTNPYIPAKELNYPFLGENRRAICFCVSYPDSPFMPDEPFVFLQKILAACKYSLDDISLVNMKNNLVSMEALKEQFNPRIVFLWGTVPTNSSIYPAWPDMEISTWNDILIVPVLRAEMMLVDNPEAQDLKRRLWVSLKKLFSL